VGDFSGDPCKLEHLFNLRLPDDPATLDELLEHLEDLNFLLAGRVLAPFDVFK
jgi:hypothetical protein